MQRSVGDAQQRNRNLSILRLRVADRLLVRLRSGRLDVDLAAGGPREWSRLHAMRAEQLESLPFRSELADNWDRVLRIATGKVKGSRNARAVLRTDQIAQAEPQISQLTALLRELRPVPPSGVAAAYVLLTDGTGPVYNPASETDLSTAVTNAIALLNSPSPLS
jgi:hypothetical protein